VFFEWGWATPRVAPRLGEDASPYLISR
jgi:hypothetical protein